MIYDEKSELRRYVIQHLWHLLTDSEQERIAVALGRGKESLRDWLVERPRRRRTGEDEPEWKPLGPSPGDAEFADRVVNRILQLNEGMALINRCPECHRVLRTLQAKLCLWCGHSQCRA